MESQHNKIVQFLYKEGFTEEELIKQTPSIGDRKTDRYSDNDEGKMRYYAALGVTLFSSNVPAVKATLQKVQALVKQGIVLQQHYSDGPQFSFTKLNEIKPQMISEATHNARKAAEQFANDSGSKVGNICRATQGRFSIEDTPRPWIKKVRVVTEVRYFLRK